MKHEFSYELRTKSKVLRISTIKARHEKSARQMLKVKYPGCTITEIKPLGKGVDFGGQNQGYNF